MAILMFRSSLETLCAFAITTPGSPVTKLRFSEPEKKSPAAVSTTGKTVNLNTKSDDPSNQELYLAVVSNGWKLEVWKLSANKNGMRDSPKLFPEIKRQSQIHNVGPVLETQCINSVVVYIELKFCTYMCKG